MTEDVTGMSNHIDPKIQEIEQRHAAATPGPWYWHGYLKSQDVDLMSETSGHPTVMGFRRWGMNGAAPSFNVDGAMERIDYGMIETRKQHSSDFHKIKHPDADLIKNSWADIAYLLSEYKRLQQENAGMKEALEWMKQRFDGDWTYEIGIGEVVDEIIQKFDDALSHLKGE
ncbi:hypothetical protein [Paenibacillus humicus]|uniref:hypothetical protein n=1 Tax=Paenibacillus humicus TaxID=412861 RepID=UPI003D294038